MYINETEKKQYISVSKKSGMVQFLSLYSYYIVSL